MLQEYFLIGFSPLQQDTISGGMRIGVLQVSTFSRHLNLPFKAVRSG